MTSPLSAAVERRGSAFAQPPTTTYKFPELSQDALNLSGEHAIEDEELDLPPLSLPNRLHSSERWQARKDSRGNGVAWGNATAHHGGAKHGRQKSLSEAIHTVRTRQGSLSQNAHEIAEALKAPVSGRLIFLCGVWYSTSILSNTSSKAILTALPKPVTLTIVQFLFVCSWCFWASWLARIYPPLRNAVPALRYGIRKPSKEIILTTLPLTAFQIGGHIMTSDAMSRIPVSLVHTIKGLSPLFTVFAYRIFSNVHYSYATYMSLVPLTLGVILACSASFRGELLGLIYAFGSTILFVTQNIVSKKIFDDSARAEADGMPTKNRKPDKLNLLCYSSGLAFLLTLPIWLWSEGFSIMGDFLQDASVELSERPGSLDHGRLALEFIFNGTFHFSQSLVAFVLLGLVSPVTYSVASLIKRVFVIVFAIIWFGNPMTPVQACGIGLTFLGLYIYDRTNDVARKEKQVRSAMQGRDALLPLIGGDAKRSDGAIFTQLPMGIDHGQGFGGFRPHANGDSSANGPKRSRSPKHISPANGSAWLPPGTKQESTWTDVDIVGVK